MTAPDLSRRGFLQWSAIGAGSLSLAVTFGGAGGSAGCGSGARGRMIRHAEATGELAPNMYITVRPDGTVELAINKAEIGQGVATGYATLVAEELAVPVAAVAFHFADARPEYRTSFRMHSTGGSTSTKEAFVPLREAAAAAREMLVAAAAARWGVPAAELTVAGGKVVHAASSRALGYGELTAAAAKLPIPAHPAIKPKSAFTVIGKTDLRVDAAAKVDGSAVFGIDVAVPGAVNAIAIHGPRYGARPERVDDDAARRAPGVIDVVALPWGVAVVAEKYWQALAAARLLDGAITWSDGPVAGLDTEAMRRAMRTHAPDRVASRDDGDAGRALGRAATVVEAIYEAPYLAHAPLEPQNCTVKVTGNRAEVWAPTQVPTILQATVADVIGGDLDDVVVHTTYAGGGFGRRVVADFAGQAASISKAIGGRAVKLVWSRASDMTQGFYRPQYAGRLRGGVDRAGQVTALEAHLFAQSIAVDVVPGLGAAMPGIPGPIRDVMLASLRAMFTSNSIPEMFSSEGLKDTPYRIPNVRVGSTPVRTELPVTTWRSVGHSFNAFAIESFVDELADAAKRDPLELRRAMLPPGSRARRVLDAVVARAGWGTPLPAGRARGLARHTSFGSEVAEVAEVELVGGRIRVRRVVAAVDCGIAINPGVIRAQIESSIIFGLSAALDQEITLVDGVVQQRNYDTFPALRMFEAPAIEVEILDSDAAPTGIGEPGLPPIAAAVGNAIFALTGVRLRRMPLQPAWNERERDQVAGGGS